MGLAAAQLAELVRELQPFVCGRPVREVQGLPPREGLLILGAETERVLRLRFSAAWEHARVHLQVGRVRAHQGPKGPFYRALEASLVGRCVEAIETVPGERIVRLSFRGDSTAGGPTLVLECFGRNANAALLDADGSIREVLVPHPADRPEARLVPGCPYAPPPAAAGRAPGSRTAEPLATSLPDPPASDHSLASAAPLSWRVEASLGREAEAAQGERLRRDLQQRLARKVKGARRTQNDLERRQAEQDAGGAERLRQDGELLKGALGSLKRGQTAVELPDYFADGAPLRRIELDPRQAPRANVERLFQRAKKLAREAERLPAELGRCEALLERLLAFQARLADPERDPFELAEEALAEGHLPARQTKPEKRAPKAPPKRLPYRSFRGLRGSEIRVGRSARDNDELSLRLSRGSDLWLHTADTPGSHVTLRLERGQDPDPEELLDAAHLAIHFSPLKGSPAADVHVARCKEIKKPRRAPAGLVTLSGGKLLRIRIEEERLERLLRGPRDGPG